MRFLVICSYTCSVFAFISVMAIVFVPAPEFLFMAILPLLQTFYTWRTSGGSHARGTGSDLLDDFTMNETNLRIDTKQPGFWLRAISVINSIALCIFFLIASSSLKKIIGNLAIGNFDKTRTIAVIFYLSCYLFVIPTLILNLRTFRREMPYLF